MRLICIDLRAGLGGHTRTAVATAESLRARGHDVHFVVNDDGDHAVVRASGIPFRTTSNRRGDLLDGLVGVLTELSEEGELDGVQIFSKLGHPACLEACSRLGVRAGLTICGGKTPDDLVPFGGFVSLSEEVRDGLAARYGLDPASVPVIRAQFDLRQLDAAFAEGGQARIDAFKEKYGVPASSRIVLRVARLSPNYERSIVEAASAVANLASEGVDVVFVHIGFAAEAFRSTERAVHKHVADLNQKAGKVVAVSAQDEARDAVAYVPMADLVVGAGRSAFEGMYAGRPTSVIGVNGFAGVVTPKTVPEIAYFNFAGRNVPSPMDARQSVALAVESFRRLLSDPARYREIATFGTGYVEDNLDVRLASARYEELFSATDYGRLPADFEVRPPNLIQRVRQIRRRLLPARFRTTVRRLWDRARP